MSQTDEERIIEMFSDFIEENAEETNLLNLEEKLKSQFLDKLFVYPKKDTSEEELAIELLEKNMSQIKMHRHYLDRFNETLIDMGGFPEQPNMLDNQKFEWLLENFQNVSLEQLELSTLL